MNIPRQFRFRPLGLVLGVGVGSALAGSNGPAVGIALGAAVAVAFGWLGRRTGCGD
jgi:hypothetical protein